MRNILLLLIVTVLSFTLAACKKEMAGDEYYWGHGFGMGYGSGCFEDRGDMISGLGIKDEDASKIAEIDEKYRSLYFEHRGDYDKINSLRQKHKKEIENILGEDQRGKYNDVYSRQWSGWGRMHGRRHMGGYYGEGYGMGHASGCWASNESMKGALELSPEQEEKISDIDSKYRELYYKERNNYREIEQLRINHRKEIEEVLTPEQKDEFYRIYDNRWRGRGSRSEMGPGMMGY
jgi:Spy/CpxP family protein refolding chaperone